MRVFPDRNSWRSPGLTSFIDKYPIVCSVEADTSGIQAKRLTDPSGGVYYQIEYEVVLLFGLTELKAQLAWQEDVSGYQPQECIRR